MRVMGKPMGVFVFRLAASKWPRVLPVDAEAHPRQEHEARGAFEEGAERRQDS